MKSTQLGTPSKCLDCGAYLDAASDMRDANECVPTPGDYTVCLYCGHLMAFAEDFSLRALTDEEMEEAAGDPDIVRYRKAVHEAAVAKKGPPR